MASVKAEHSYDKLLNRKPKLTTDFSKVGGLSNHIKILRDTIIVPLLHNNVYSHFNIKTPRGVLFYGPPGTGKTLVAGALATELNKEGLGRVSFYQRKGADVLDKWVGESEKKLRALFETATKCRPSIIFFDELDGLAPIRSAKNDHVHCSIVTTLLALMDGLDSVPGVIVIGATNRIESVDPALRRSGRFDKELYFPLPSTDARKEILQVHMQSWKQKPSSEFIAQLAEMTTGFCGSDLQALCAEALLCALKRQYPNVHECPLGTKVKIEANVIKIEECDLINATKNLTPAAHKLGSRMRKLSPTITPLLQKQLDLVLSRLQMLWPHFFIQFHRYLIGRERYVGRVLLIGSNQQGLNTHLIPAILQAFEHLPFLFMDAAAIQNRSILPNFCKNLPSVLVISRIDDLWNFLEIYEQNYIVSILEDVHAGLPILIIATCEEELPLMKNYCTQLILKMSVLDSPTSSTRLRLVLKLLCSSSKEALSELVSLDELIRISRTRSPPLIDKQLQNFFYNNTSLVISIENPSDQEVEDFFVPLFFGESSSLSAALRQGRSSETAAHKKPKCATCSSKVYKLKQSGKITKPRANSTMKKTLNITPDKGLGRPLSKHFGESGEVKRLDAESLCTLCAAGTVEKRKRLSSILTELLQRSFRYFTRKKAPSEGTSSKMFSLIQNFGDTNDVDKQIIYSLWKRTAAGAKDMSVAHLEVLYDTISACISIHKDNFHNLITNLEDTLDEIESTKS